MFLGILDHLGGFSWSFQLYIRAFQATPTPHTSRLNSWNYSFVAPWMPLAAALPWREAAVYVWGVGLHRDAALGGLTLGYQFGILFETKVFIEHSWFVWKGNRPVPAITILGEGASFFKCFLWGWDGCNYNIPVPLFHIIPIEVKNMLLVVFGALSPMNSSLSSGIMGPATSKQMSEHTRAT